VNRPIQSITRIAQTTSISRRDALRGLGMATASVLFCSDADGQFGPFRYANQPVDLIFSTLSARALRIRIVPKGVQGAAPNEDAALVDFVERHRAITNRLLTTGAIRVSVARDPLSIRIARSSGELIQELRESPNSGELEFSVGDAPLLGLGEGGAQFDRRGSQDAMRSGQDGYQLRTHGGRVPIQWLVSTAGWGLFIHQPIGTLDLTAARGRLASESPLPADLFVIVSANPRTIMREYARITGLAAMPPLWTFGYQQSHRTLAGPEEVMAVARTMRAKKLPCDTLIYLGTDFTPSGWNTHNGEFTWNSANFPDPKKAIDDLHSLDFKVVLHAVIEGRHLTGTVKDGCPAPEPSGRTPDGRWPDQRHVGCYWPHHKGVIDLGIDGWWPDQGDGLDPASRLNRIRDVLGRPAIVASGRTAVCPSSERLRRHGALRCVSLVGRRVFDVGDTQNARSGCNQHWAQRHSVLGHGYRRLRADAGVHRRALRPLVPVRSLLSAVPRSRPDLASAAAVGMEHRGTWPRRSVVLPRRRQSA
jgi:alpha-glucosidase/alpha-D-xyloside xylohydrolase